MKDHHPIICIFGSYSPVPGEPLYELAYQIGRGLAEAGFVVANGGYEGIMEASARGAKDGGGTTIGVTCSMLFNERGRPEVNPYIDREIPHTDLLARIREMMEMSAGYVVLEGGTGTLSEFGIVWEFVGKGFIGARPIFVVGDFWRPMVERLIEARPKHGRHIHWVETAEELTGLARDIIPTGAR